MKNKIYYKSGYKYQLAKDYSIEIDIFPIKPIHTGFSHLYCDGTLIIQAGYAWDGPSGAIDTKNFMRGSLVHDIIYQFIREGFLPGDMKKKADELLRKVCIEDGMSLIRAWWVYHGVKWFADFATDPKNKRQILTAP